MILGGWWFDGEENLFGLLVDIVLYLELRVVLR